MKSFVLRGDFVSAPEPDRLESVREGYMVVENGVIRGLYPVLPEQYRGIPAEDYSGKLILQSFSDMHLHAPQYPMLGMGMDLQLLDWLQAYAFPNEARFRDPDYAREEYARLSGDLIRAGTTRVVMFSSLHTDATLILMEELEKAGITGYVGKVNMDRNATEGYQETTEESVSETIRFIEESSRFHKIRPIITPRFTPSCSDRLMKELGRIAREYGLYVQSHLSENLQEMEWVRILHPDCSEYWETYDKFGLFGDHTVMAHCIWSGERERKVMRERNVLAVHCPDSNVNVCSGQFPMARMLDEGNWVALGSDIAGGADYHMNRVMTGAIRTSKARRIQSGWEERFLQITEAYYLGTTAGAVYFGTGKGFAAGDRLHAVVVDERSFPKNDHLTLQERLERALYLMDEKNIDAVFSDGEKAVGSAV